LAQVSIRIRSIARNSHKRAARMHLHTGGLISNL